MSQKARDERGRWRNKTVAFRMSEEENRILDTKVSLSGLTKQAVSCLGGESKYRRTRGYIRRSEIR